MDTTEIDKKIKRASKQLTTLHQEKNELLRGTLIKCGGCGTESQIRNLTYIQTHWYESPWGCTGGDTWHQGEGQFDCPECKHRLRPYNRPELMALKHLFKDVVKEHKR